MVTQDYRAPQHGSQDRGALAQQQSDQERERAAKARDLSADRYSQHAALLDRYGAHRSANTERRHAEEERHGAKAARRNATRQLGRGHGEVSRHG